MGLTERCNLLTTLLVPFIVVVCISSRVSGRGTGTVLGGVPQQAPPPQFDQHLMSMPMPMPDPIDLCIFSCDRCFRGKNLVGCANTCIASQGNMSPIWGRLCSEFGPEFQNFRPGSEFSKEFL